MPNGHATGQDLAGKTFFVTGANTGIGRVTACELAKRGARVWLACRSEERTRPVLDEIRAMTGKDAGFVDLDLGDLASVKRAASAFLASGEPLDGLINNAGLAGSRGVTKDGFERTFGVNHLGHFLLTKLLLPRMRDRKGARLVNVSSKAHAQAKALDFAALRQSTVTKTGIPEYAVSKLCNVLFTREIARREPSVHSYALHPGVVASDVWRHVPWPFGSLMKLFMITNEEGAKTTLYCATSPAVAEQTGRYYDHCAEKRAEGLSNDDALARKLWDASEEWTAAFAN
jgi:NAD(P)-dependent dehydrogenase (short-subunit alcohol dehydrogenase family)